MKVIAFQIVGKKAAKKCKTIGDIIRLITNIINNNPNLDSDVVQCLISEQRWLMYEKRIVLSFDIDFKMPSNLTMQVDEIKLKDLHPVWAIRFCINGEISTIELYGDAIFRIVNHSFNSNNNSVSTTFIGDVNVFNQTVQANENVIFCNADRKSIEKNLTQTLFLITNIINETLLLNNISSAPRVKNGKLFIHSQKIKTEQFPHLVATHLRHEHFKILRHPRFYKDGMVPVNENELRRIKVKETVVNRDIIKYNAVSV